MISIMAMNCRSFPSNIFLILMKYQRDVSPIEDKVLAMYARGMSQRDIAATIEDIYGFEMSHEQISHITDCVMEEVDRWRTRPLKPFYPFAFVDCFMGK